MVRRLESSGNKRRVQYDNKGEMLVSKEVQVPRELVMIKYTKNDDHKERGRGV